MDVNVTYPLIVNRSLVHDVKISFIETFKYTKFVSLIGFIINPKGYKFVKTITPAQHVNGDFLCLTTSGYHTLPYKVWNW